MTNIQSLTDERRIKLLPPELCNQIAAGEVVERPASVLKELVENSLDAGATDITVRIEDGGQTLISVRDNGRGIPAKDLELALTRHATSKVASFEELLHVTSYGFRGEALPSIASVAEVRLESAFEKDEGAFIEVHHGKTVASGPSPILAGTLVEVRGLFANVPARLKFLKSPATEARRCQDTLMRLALARPGVTFRLYLGSREAFILYDHMDLRARLEALWPPQVVEHLFALSGERNGITVSGLASLPQSVQAKSDRMLFYVNSRAVNDRLLAAALREAYKGRLISREYPQAVIFITMPAEELDVNVHPAKTEVRFRDERSVFSALMHVVNTALGDNEPGSFGKPFDGAFGSADGQTKDRQGEPAPPASTPLPLPDVPGHTPRPKGFWGSMDRPRIMERPEKTGACDDDISSDAPPTEGGFALSGPSSGGFTTAEARERSGSYYSFDAGGRPTPDTSSGQEATPRFTDATEVFSALEREETDKTAQPEAGQVFSGGYPVTVGSLTCLGQVAKTYLILLEGDNMLLLDQHAAHERVRLHQIEKEAGSGQSQLLMLPVELALHPAEGRRLQERFQELAQLGFTLETAGADSLRVLGLPPLLEREQALAFLRDVLADRTDGLDSLLHLMACRSAIKAGQILTADEAAGLLSQWMNTPDCRYCPHGRPVVLAFSPSDMEKLFKRKA